MEDITITYESIRMKRMYQEQLALYYSTMSVASHSKHGREVVCGLRTASPALQY